MSKKKPSLGKCTRKLLKEYFKLVDDASQVRHLYSNVMMQVEKPMLQMVMKKTKGNKLRAAKMLGINRNTLHAKLKIHKLD